MNKGLLIIVSAPSGAGKTSLIEKLLPAMDDIEVAISHTTRNQRPGEISGGHYYFVDKPTFQNHIDNGDFLEYAEVFDNFYGTSKNTVDALLAKGKNVILEIDWQGARTIRKAAPDAISIFILPPSETALEQRLKGRAQDSDAVIAKRLEAACSDMSHYDEYQYVVINDDFEIALQDLKSIIRAENLKPTQQQTELKAVFGS